MLAILAGVLLKSCTTKLTMLSSPWVQEQCHDLFIGHSNLSWHGGSKQLCQKPPFHGPQGMATGETQCSTVILNRGLQQLNEECSKWVGTDGIRAVKLVEEEDGSHSL